MLFHEVGRGPGGLGPLCRAVQESNRRCVSLLKAGCTHKFDCHSPGLSQALLWHQTSEVTCFSRGGKPISPPPVSSLPSLCLCVQRRCLGEEVAKRAWPGSGNDNALLLGHKGQLLLLSGDRMKRFLSL